MANRIDALDGLRGFAAASVVVHHVLTSADRPAPPAHWAVMLFFVLSGYVLALSWIAGRPLPWPAFLVRRLCRLWPPVIAAVLLSAGLFLAIGPRAPFIGDYWLEPLSTDLWTRCLLLTGQHGACSLVQPLWSLVFEARISLIYPLILAATLRAPRAMSLAAIVWVLRIDVSTWIEGQWPAIAADGWLGGIALTLHFAGFFVAGILLAAHGQAPIRWFKPFPALIAAIVLALLPSDTTEGVAGLLLIAIATRSAGAVKLLTCGPLRWLGRVSYSLYVIHWPILLAVFYGFGGPLTLAGGLLVVALSGATAEILYRLVERPSIALGRRLTSGSHQAAAVTA